MPFSPCGGCVSLSGRACLKPASEAIRVRPGRSGDPVGLLRASAVAGTGTGAGPARAMLVSPFTFYRAAALRSRRTSPRLPPRGCRCSCAGTPTCRVSARSPPRSGGWSSTSTTSTRPGPVRSSGRQPAGREPGRGRAGQRVPRQGSTQDRASGRQLPLHRHARVRGAAFPGRLVFASGHRAGPERVRSQVKAKKLKEFEKLLAKAPPGQHPALAKLTTVVDGQRRIISVPPTIVLSKASSVMSRPTRFTRRSVRLGKFRRSLQPDRRHLLRSSPWCRWPARSSGSAASPPAPGSC